MNCRKERLIFLSFVFFVLFCFFVPVTSFTRPSFVHSFLTGEGCFWSQQFGSGFQFKRKLRKRTDWYLIVDPSLPYQKALMLLRVNLRGKEIRLAPLSVSVCSQMSLSCTKDLHHQFSIFFLSPSRFGM